MIPIFISVFILTFSLVFCGCPVCQIKNNVSIEHLIELCTAIEWSSKSYEERSEYSIRPLLDNIKKDLTESQDLRKETAKFVEGLQLPTGKKINTEIDKFLEEVFDKSMGEEDKFYTFAKEEINKKLGELNECYSLNPIPENVDRLEKIRAIQARNVGKERCINYIVSLICITNDAKNKGDNNKAREFIRELRQLYDKEKGTVDGFIELPLQRKGKKMYNNKSYNIDDLYREFTNFYKEYDQANDSLVKNEQPGFYKEYDQGNDSLVKNEQPGTNNEQGFEEDFINLLKERIKKIDKKMKGNISADIAMVKKDVPRTCYIYSKGEGLRILKEMLFFAIFVLHIMNADRENFHLSVDDIESELSSMQDIDHTVIQEMSDNIKKSACDFKAYHQGLNFFAAFFVILYFEQHEFDNDSNKKQIDRRFEQHELDNDFNKKQIDRRSEIIKLFTFYLLRKWQCNAFMNYLPSCSFYELANPYQLFVFIFLRRCKMLHMYKNFALKADFFAYFLSAPLCTYNLLHTQGNDPLSYIMYRNMHFFTVKSKDINFYFNWFSFLHYKFLHVVAENDLKYYGAGHYAEITKAWFSSSSVLKEPENRKEFFKTYYPEVS